MHKLHNKSDEELKKLAKKLYNNEMYLALNNDSEALQSFSMLLMLAEPDQLPASDSIGAIYAFYGDPDFQQAPIGINGRPIFFGCAFLNIEDAQKLLVYYNQIKHMLENF